MLTALNIALPLLATALALWLRPWRLVGPDGPPTPWWVLAACMPLLWSLDLASKIAIAQPLSFAPLLVLLAGWPMAVLICWPVAIAAALLAPLDPLEACHRLLWLGIAPATFALAIGALLRRILPHHFFVYIIARAFLGTIAASTLAAAGAIALHPTPVGTAEDDLLLARLLAAFGEAFLTGMVTAIGVAFRPHWLATYSDRLYLPPKPAAPRPTRTDDPPSPGA